MDQKQRIAMQRAMAQEALGKLRAISELFGAEQNAVAGGAGTDALHKWESQIDQLERWIFDESPIA